MNRLSLSMAILGLVLIITLYAWSQKTDVHNFEGICTRCHLNIPEKGKKKIFIRDISRLCEDCHEEGKGLTHPVDIRPSMKIPSTFILDWKGEITCVTCHNAHGKEGEGSYLLRVKMRGESFCRNCHDFIESGFGMHKGTVESAHFARRYRENDRGEFIDESSRNCLNCHDAAFSKDIFPGREINTGVFEHNPGLGLSHPIGADYFETSRKYMGAYVRPESLNPEIRLFNGRVGCGSCHNPYSKRHFQLVMSNEHSALCFACHVK
ncbi:MAG: cytochrome c3 family protein [Thermodesulfobacteriota bacterium]